MLGFDQQQQQQTTQTNEHMELRPEGPGATHSPLSARERLALIKKSQASAIHMQDSTIQIKHITGSHFVTHL